MAEGDDDPRDEIIAKLRTSEAQMRKKLRDVEAERDQLSSAAGDRDKELADAKATGAAEARAELDRTHAQALAAAELRAAAARVLADPDDAPRFLDMTKVLTPEGTVDPEKVKTELDGLIERKPYLAVEAGGNGSTPPAPKPTGSGDGGPRPAGGGDPDARMNELIHKAVGRS